MRLSLDGRHFAAVVLGCVCLGSYLLCGGAAAQETKVGGQPTEAAQLVKQALAAEAQGDSEARADLLRQALEKDPDYPPARWHSGEVRVGEQWLSMEAAAAATVRSGKMDEYRRLRDSAAATADAQLALARRCAAAGLDEQERVHLTQALYLGPSKRQGREAISKLGLVRYRGVLLSRDQLKKLNRQKETAAAAAREWKPRLAGIKRDIADGDTTLRRWALEELRSIRDPLAIPLLESLSAEGQADVTRSVVAALAAMPGQAAVDSLVRHAIFSKQERMRKASTEALKARALFAYMPTLMAAIQLPVDVDFQTQFIDGQVQHRLSLYQEGPAVDYSFVSFGASQTHDHLTIRRLEGLPPATLVRLITPDMTFANDAAIAKRELVANEVREKVNQRAVNALRVLTRNNLDANPQLWWNWWYDYNEIYQPPVKPVVEQRVDATPLIPYSYSVIETSCFVAGTPVWTSTGPLPIERIGVGESVLAQDAESGELAYKPVMATTVRPPSPLVNISAGGATIRATRGHPFWVDGLGWQMAKELKAGQFLHTPQGPVLIESAEQSGEAVCYNMVVADFNAYFVGDAQVLVHDNNLRQVTTATVPGLTEAGLP